MALSLWDQYSDLQHSLNPEMFSFQHPAAVEFDDDFDYYFNLFSFSNNGFGFGFDYDYVSDTFSDHNYNQFPSLLNDDNQFFNTTDHQYFSSSSSSSLSDNFIFPLEEFECYHTYPKRQKTYYGDGVDVDHHSVTFSPELFSGCVSNVINPPVPPPLPEFLPEIPTPPLAGFSFEKSSNADHESSTKKPNGVSLSAQSIAARERRRKITQKTQELGKLIPGGHRMNTAEMFQAASKYVKFLQAQVKLLQLMEPTMQVKKKYFFVFQKRFLYFLKQ